MMNAPETTEFIHAEIMGLYGEITSLCQIERIDGVLNMSVATMLDHQRKGFASAIVARALIWFADSEFRNETLHWWAREDNVASIRLAESNGFILSESCHAGWLHYQFSTMMEYVDENLPAPAHLECAEYHNAIAPHGFPDAVIFANDGNPLEGTYETRRYVTEPTHCRNCKRSRAGGTKCLRWVHGTYDEAAGEDILELQDVDPDGFCAWSEPSDT